MNQTEKHLTKLQKRVDFAIVEQLIPHGSRVLDLGCSDGTLLRELIDKNKVTGYGVEISEEGVASCIAKGLSVFQGDISEGLSDYKDTTFDYVLMIRTVQAVKDPRAVIEEMIRVGRRGVISFPNFGHILIRLKLLFSGRMPKNRMLPYEWYDTPNIHLLTIKDFRRFCRRFGITIERTVYLPRLSRRRALLANIFPNLFARFGLFVISRKTPREAAPEAK